MVSRRLLYKYKSLSGEYGPVNAEDIIIHARMRWQSPRSFNDPFDCSPDVVFGFDQSERKRWVRRVADRREALINRRERRAFFKRSIRSRSVHDVAAELRDYFDRTISESSVTCFSLKEHNTLMWAHYADAHRGVCFTFEEKPEEGFYGVSVHYTMDRDVVDLAKFHSDGVKNVERAVFTKSLDWEYEEEVRMFSYSEPPGYKGFPRAALKRVTLGLRTSAEDEAMIKSLATKRRPNLEVYRTVFKPGSFELSSVPVPAD